MIRERIRLSKARFPRTDVSLLTPETHTTCVSRFMAINIYGSQIGDSFETFARLLKPWITSSRRNMKMGSERRCCHPREPSTGRQRLGGRTV